MDQPLNSLRSSTLPARPVSNPQRQSTGFKNVPVGQKLSIIALVLLIPLFITVFFLIFQAQQAINTTNKERQGVEYLIPLRIMLEHVLEARTLSAMWLSGVDVEEAWRGEVTEINEAIAQIQAVDTKYGTSFDTSSQAQTLLESWQTLTRAVENKSISVSESTQRHDQFLKSELIALITEVGNQSNLILDPELDSYYAMNLAVVQLPALTKTMGDMMQLAIETTLKGQASPEDLASLGALTALAQNGFDNSAQSKGYIVQANPSFAPQIQPLIDAGATTKSEFLGTINQIMASPVLPAKEERLEFFETIMGKIDPEFEAYDRSIEILDNLLQLRVQNLQTQSLFILAGVLLALFIAVGLVVSVSQQITRPLNELTFVSRQVGKGDLSKLSNVTSRDEIGILAGSLNNAILQLRDANTRQEAEIESGKQLQNNIGEFLNVAMDIAQGDFTRRGQVSEDALGNVVDAINFMTEELGYVLKNVQSATDSVNQGATDMFGTADTIAHSAQIQAVEAQKAREDVQDIRSTMRQVSEDMMTSAESANKALSASREGQQAVVKTLEGMQDIRREVQAVSKRVKTLGDRSLEISEIVETISRISEQTNLLAVNAAIESSGAGEAGLRFAVVADQVRKLAEESAYAAERVSILIKTVQDEVQEVITGVEAGTREVEEGYRVASQAGQRLEDISTIVERSASLAQRISQATQDQVARVEQVGQVVEQMAEISVQSQDTVTKGREAAEKLQQLAAQLSDNLSRFRLA